MLHLNRINCKGYSLLSIMVAISVSMILILAISKFFTQEYRYYKYVTSKMKLEDLRSIIRTNIYCEHTIPSPLPVECTTPAGGAIEVLTKNSLAVPLIPIPVGNTFKRFGIYALRGWCQDSGGRPKLTIEVNMLSPDGSSAIGDSLKNRLMNGYPLPTTPSNTVGWVDLYGGIPVCI